MASPVFTYYTQPHGFLLRCNPPETGVEWPCRFSGVRLRRSILIFRTIPEPTLSPPRGGTA